MNFKKNFFLAKIGVIAFFVLSCVSKPISNANRLTASISLSDVSYTFDIEKVKNADNAFLFMRSFVDYFYLINAKNSDLLSGVKYFSNYPGKCVGDAHAENFGFLYQADGKPKFTMNDMDDFGPCPVFLDLFRFMSSSALFDSRVDINLITKAYIQGLRGETLQPPLVIQDLLNKSDKRGMALNPKKIQNLKFIRDEENSDVDSATLTALKNEIEKLYAPVKVLDVVKSFKSSGGSAGLARFQILIESEKSQIHLELKEQVRPSIYPVATEPLADMKNKILGAIKFEQGSSPVKWYGYLNFQGKDMLVRPIYWGNTGANLGDVFQDNMNLMLFESFTLGQIHRAGVSKLPEYITAIENYPVDELKADVSLMVDFMSQKYKSLNSQK